jgi:FhuF 2Fe-2S C-terminal domain
VITSLADVLARVRAADPYLAVGIGRDDRDPAHWLTPERLAADPDRLVALADAYGARWGVAGDRTSQASFIVLDLSWYAFAPLVATYLAAGVVPSLGGAQVWLEPSTREGSLALAAGPVARESGIAALRSTIEAYAAPLVEAIVARRWLGRRTAWAGVGDRVVGAFEHLGPALADADRARASAEALIHHPGSRLDSPRHRFVTYGAGPDSMTLGLRATCCRFHRVPDVDYCLTCPLLPEADRQKRAAVELVAAPAS